MKPRRFGYFRIAQGQPDWLRLLRSPQLGYPQEMLWLDIKPIERQRGFSGAQDGEIHRKAICAKLSRHWTKIIVPEPPGDPDQNETYTALFGIDCCRTRNWRCLWSCARAQVTRAGFGGPLPSPLPWRSTKLLQASNIRRQTRPTQNKPFWIC